MARILILGGTEDGLHLHVLLERETGVEPLLSLAGRTKAPAHLPTGTRIGGFGGAGGLAEFLAHERITALVDATHPFAKTISANAAIAAEMTGFPFLTLLRLPWEPETGDRWRHIEDEAEAAQLLQSGARVFLALGAQRLGAFSTRPDVSFVVRVVDTPNAPLLPFRHEVIVDRGPFNIDGERNLLSSRGVTAVVARNSGGIGAFAKIEAARALNIPVVMIRRPPAAVGIVVPSAAMARDWVMKQLG